MKTGRVGRHPRLLLKDLAFVLRILVSGWRATQPMPNTSMADLEGKPASFSTLYLEWNELVAGELVRWLRGLDKYLEVRVSVAWMWRLARATRRWRERLERPEVGRGEADLVENCITAKHLR
jgi:hypothetical protein